MLYGADKLTHFRCLGGWGGCSPVPAASPTPDPYAGFLGALSVFFEHGVEGIPTLYCSLIWGKGRRPKMARIEVGIISVR